MEFGDTDLRGSGVSEQKSSTRRPNSFINFPPFSLDSTFSALTLYGIVNSSIGLWIKYRVSDE